MAKTYFIPKQDAARLAWLINFNTKLNFYAIALGITAQALVIVLEDLNAYSYTFSLKGAVKKYALTVTLFLKSLSTKPDQTVAAAFPVLAVPGTAPTAVPLGIFCRCAILVKQLKANPLCTEAIQTDLGIIGTDINPDFSTAQPLLKMFLTGGYIGGRYKRGQTNGVYIESKRGTETVFSHLLTANKATFTDTRPNLVAGQAETRQYRAWYFVDDVVVGVVSLVFTISVNI